MQILIGVGWTRTIARRLKVVGRWSLTRVNFPIDESSESVLARIRWPKFWELKKTEEKYDCAYWSDDQQKSIK